MAYFDQLLSFRSDDIKGFWETALFRLLGAGLASGILWPMAWKCLDQATHSSGAPAALLFGLAVCFILLGLVGGQILGALIYRRLFTNLFAAHEWDALHILTISARLLGVLVVAYSGGLIVVAWHSVGTNELGLYTMVLAMGIAVMGFALDSWAFSLLDILLVGFNAFCSFFFHNWILLLMAWVCLAMAAISYGFSRIRGPQKALHKG